MHGKGQFKKIRISNLPSERQLHGFKFFDDIKNPAFKDVKIA